MVSPFLKSAVVPMLTPAAACARAGRTPGEQTKENELTPRASMARGLGEVWERTVVMCLWFVASAEPSSCLRLVCAPLRSAFLLASGMIAGRSAARRASVNQADLRAAHKDKQREQRAQAEAWFSKFDLEGDGVLQRSELATLLKHTTGIDPSDEALDMALADARAADIKGGSEPKDGVSKKAATAVVTKFSVRPAASLAPLSPLVDRTSHNALYPHGGRAPTAPALQHRLGRIRLGAPQHRVTAAPLTAATPQQHRSSTSQLGGTAQPCPRVPTQHIVLYPHDALCTHTTQATSRSRSLTLTPNVGVHQGAEVANPNPDPNPNPDAGVHQGAEVARFGLRQVRHEQERSAREGPAHRVAQASLPWRRGERCRRGLCARHGRPEQHRQVSTRHRLPRSTFHAPLTTRFPPYYLLLTTYHLPLTTCYLLRQHPPLRGSRGVRDLEERARVGQRT